MYSSFFSVIFPLLLFVIFLVKWLYTSSSSSSHPKKKNFPPSPLKLPIIGNLHQLCLSSSRPHRSLQSLSQKHGRDLMLLHLGKKLVLIVSSAKAAKEIMKTHDLIFSSRPKLTIPSKLLYNGKDVAFSPYGEHWRHVRSICVIHLLSNKMVRSFRHAREEETSEMMEKIKSRSFNLNLSDLFLTLTNDVICRVALGKKYGEEEESGRRAKAVLSEFVELMGTFCVGDYLPWIRWLEDRFNGLDAKIERLSRELDELIETSIEEHVNRRMECCGSSPTLMYLFLCGLLCYGLFFIFFGPFICFRLFVLMGKILDRTEKKNTEKKTENSERRGFSVFQWQQKSTVPIKGQTWSDLAEIWTACS